jgi:hypothetical protein
MASFPVFTYQVCAPQETQMLRNGGAGHRKGAGDLSRGPRTTAQKIENGATGGISEGLEDGFAAPGRRICNRTVTHNA